MMHVDKESDDLALAAALADEYSARLQFLGRPGERGDWVHHCPVTGLWSKHEAAVAVQAAAAAVIGRAGLAVQEPKLRRVIKMAQTLPEFNAYATSLRTLTRDLTEYERDRIENIRRVAAPKQAKFCRQALAGDAYAAERVLVSLR